MTLHSLLNILFSLDFSDREESFESPLKADRLIKSGAFFYICACCFYACTVLNNTTFFNVANYNYYMA